MRVHIFLEDELVEDLDELVGPRGRSPFIALAVRKAVESEHRWNKLESAFGSIPDIGHDWDGDPAAWVHEQRRKSERPLP